MITKSAGTAVLAILVATLGLAGCTASEPEGQTQTQTQTARPTTEPTDEPTESATPEVPAPANGEALTTPEQIAAAEAAGLDAYQLDNGAVIAVDPTQPLPQPVVDEANANVGAQYSTYESNRDALAAAARSVDGKTTKNVIVIYPMLGSKDGVIKEALYRIESTYRDQMAGYPGSMADPQPLVALAEAWIAQQARPETYQVVVVPVP